MSHFSLSPLLPSPERPFAADGIEYIGYMDPEEMHSEFYNDRTYALQMVLPIFKNNIETSWQEVLAPHVHLLPAIQMIRSAYLLYDADSNTELSATIKIGPYNPSSSAQRMHQDKGMLDTESLYFCSAPFSTIVDGHGESVPGGIVRIPGDTRHSSPSRDMYYGQPRTFIRAAALNF